MSDLTNQIVFDFQEGETLLINKPLDWTSFNVVSKIRYIIRHNTGIKKIKVGHAGTLDPKATGLLIICTGRNTKKIQQYQDSDKDYTGSFLLGKSTPSFDTETDIDHEYPITHIHEELIRETAQKFLGEQEQIPPIFSAIQVKGKRAYNYARNKEQLELKARKIHIHEFQIEKVDVPSITFRILCSKGTYIRSLARDFGKALSSGAYLSSLCRTRIGEFKLEDAMEISAFEEIIKKLYANRT
ncbi:MAG: tRNA pseudouridine(55) synthase TruB [Bacteroidales bacterium]|nr:tRNA pseudouridine(55) synthase TruB [Bacteroidales bacterium]MCF8386260.1 tRNA pseudouridine(55) synthase TruB [Bacteroidales bacterium]MCF8397513.1 tRNA pseudouridine(55) synthase TruB [Bacteroidales bacterium]